MFLMSLKFKWFHERSTVFKGASEVFLGVSVDFLRRSISVLENFKGFQILM